MLQRSEVIRYKNTAYGHDGLYKLPDDKSIKCSSNTLFLHLNVYKNCDNLFDFVHNNISFITFDKY